MRLLCYFLYSSEDFLLEDCLQKRAKSDGLFTQLSVQQVKIDFGDISLLSR